MDEYLEKKELLARIEDTERDLAKMDNGSRWLKRFVILVLVASTAALAVGAWMMWWPFLTVDKSPMPMPVVKGYETVRQGGVVVYEYDFTKYTDVIPTVHRQFVDGIIFESADSTTHLAKGEGHIQVDVPIPLTLPPGHYRIRVYSDYRMNAFRTISSMDQTEDFTVLPANGHPDASQDASTTSK